MTEPVWDAVVVGAGPAGSVAARELARRGASVLLLDKATFPRPKVCGGCLNAAAIAALEAIGLGHVPGECGAVPLRSVMLAAGRSAAELALPGGAAVSREALDAALVREAVAAGVTFWPGTAARVENADGHMRSLRLTPSTAATSSPPPLRGRSPRSGGWGGFPDTPPTRIAPRSDLPRKGGGEDRDATASARTVVMATGLAGTPAPPQAGSKLGGGTLVPAELTPSFFARGTVYMAAGRGGYVGLVRVEDDRLDVAAAFDPEFVRANGGLGPAAAVILRMTRWPAIPGLADLPWKGTPALTRRPAAVAGHRLFAVGDAAGYVEPFTGEGMAWAVASAAALAPIARRATLEWDDRLIAEWQRTYTRVVRRRQGVCRAAARVLRSPVLTGIAVRALSFLPILSRPVVAALNRPATLHGLPA